MANMSDCRTSLESTQLSTRILPVVQYRLKQIRVRSSDAIDQIKMMYTDGTEFSVGHPGGRSALRPVIMCDGEFIVRVTHERFDNFKCAGAAVEFETNRGRRFEFSPRMLTTRLQSERITVVVRPGHEIVGLLVRHGALLGTIQQPAQAKWTEPVRQPWFMLLSASSSTSNGQPSTKSAKSGVVASAIATAPVVTRRSFHSKAAAETAWLQAVTSLPQADDGAVLVNCLTSRELRHAGSSQGVSACRQHACTKGLLVIPRLEHDVSMWPVLHRVAYELREPSDMRNFVCVTGLLLLASYLTLEMRVATGRVVSMLSTEDNARLVAMVQESEIASAVMRFVAQWRGEHEPVLVPSTSTLRNSIMTSMALVAIAQAAVHMLRTYARERICFSKNNVLRHQALTKVLSLDQSYYDTHSREDIHSSTKHDTINEMLT